MQLSDLIVFRKDLLFNGAVQIDWRETNQDMGLKAAQCYVFHGPQYHGATAYDSISEEYNLEDTASFTQELVKRLTGNIQNESMMLAIAGYGTGKSHLGLTLSELLSDIRSPLSQHILANLSLADASICSNVKSLLSDEQPYLVVAINGMKDFDLYNEIVRQIMHVLQSHGLNSSVLENLRPRFRIASKFTEAFYHAKEPDFQAVFEESMDYSTIIEHLGAQDEDTFRRVNKVYERYMETPIPAAGQEAMHDFISVVTQHYCGEGRPFKRLLIIFDEFGRYMEFAVQRPHVAGAGALQQLFECVQNNSERMTVVNFVQYELKAYIARIAPERREDVNRYVTRFDGVPKFHLSTNLETLIANLLEKSDSFTSDTQVSGQYGTGARIQKMLLNWFPGMNYHHIWTDLDKFKRIVLEGCWPLHPISTWILFRLSTVGKSLQQRSALSLIAEIFDQHNSDEVHEKYTILPVDMCVRSLMDEFLASERDGVQGAPARAYEQILSRYSVELNESERAVLKAALLILKTDVKSQSKEDYVKMVKEFTDLPKKDVDTAISSLETEYAVLVWNDKRKLYEIAGDAAPRRAFEEYVSDRMEEISLEGRAQLFVQELPFWVEKKHYILDYETERITTTDWNYSYWFCNAINIRLQAMEALKAWRNASDPDANKGQLMYCYIGPESNRDAIASTVEGVLDQIEAEQDGPVPIVALMLDDQEGALSQNIARYFVLLEMESEKEGHTYQTFVSDALAKTLLDLHNCLNQMEQERKMIFCPSLNIAGGRMKTMLKRVFDQIYPARAAFPFDGFSTPRGNAATDCMEFTKRLFLDDLTTDKIATFRKQQQNRAVTVLDKAWGVFDESGEVRLKPKDPKIRKIVERLEEHLDESCRQDMINEVSLGSLIKMLCSPPFGCNIASAGLVIGVCFAARKERWNYIYKGNSLDVETWVQKAFGNRYLEFSVWEDTTLDPVTEETISEWDQLLREWHNENSHTGRLDYQEEALQLETRHNVPPSLVDKYELLKRMTDESADEVHKYNKTLREAVSDIERGCERGDVALLVSSAVRLDSLLRKTQANEEIWTMSQRKAVEEPIPQAMKAIQEIFPQWLDRQRVPTLEHIAGFKKNMKYTSNDLGILGFSDEKRRLEEFAHETENQVRFRADLHGVINEISALDRSVQPTTQTSIISLNGWVREAHDCAKKLEEAAKNIKMELQDQREAKKKLVRMIERCEVLKQEHSIRLEEIYNIEEFCSIADITDLSREVSNLLAVYKGMEQDESDLMLVKQQLDQFEESFRRLSAHEMTEEELTSLFEKCRQEMQEAYEDDDPPLPDETLWASLLDIIHIERNKLADQWMTINLRNRDAGETMEGRSLIEFKQRLERAPAYLSEANWVDVETALLIADTRLNTLEVDGVFARFEALSEQGKNDFLERIRQYAKV